MNYTILTIEAAINNLRAIEPPRNGILGANLRALAELYGRMIFQRTTRVSRAALTPAQCSAVDIALARINARER